MTPLHVIIAVLLVVPSAYGGRWFGSIEPDGYNRVRPRFVQNKGCSTTLWITQLGCTTTELFVTANANASAETRTETSGTKTEFATVVRTNTEFTATTTKAITITVTGTPTRTPTVTGRPGRIIRNPSFSEIVPFRNCSQITTVTSTTFSCTRTLTETLVFLSVSEVLKILPSETVSSTTTLYQNIKTHAVEQSTVIVTVQPNNGLAPPGQSTTVNQVTQPTSPQTQPSLAQTTPPQSGGVSQEAQTTPRTTEQQQPPVQSNPISRIPNVKPETTTSPAPIQNSPSTSRSGPSGGISQARTTPRITEAQQPPAQSNHPISRTPTGRFKTTNGPEPIQSNPSTSHSGPNRQLGTTRGQTPIQISPSTSKNVPNGQPRTTNRIIPTESSISVSNPTSNEQPRIQGTPAGNSPESSGQSAVGTTQTSFRSAAHGPATIRTTFTSIVTSSSGGIPVATFMTVVTMPLATIATSNGAGATRANFENASQRHTTIGTTFATVITSSSGGKPVTTFTTVATMPLTTIARASLENVPHESTTLSTTFTTVITSSFGGKPVATFTTVTTMPLTTIAVSNGLGTQTNFGSAPHGSTTIGTTFTTVITSSSGGIPVATLTKVESTPLTTIAIPNGVRTQVSFGNAPHGSPTIWTSFTTVITSSSDGIPVTTFTTVESMPLTTLTYISGSNTSTTNKPAGTSLSAPVVASTGGPGGRNMGLSLQIIIGGLFVVLWF